MNFHVTLAKMKTTEVIHMIILLAVDNAEAVNSQTTGRSQREQMQELDLKVNVVIFCNTSKHSELSENLDLLLQKAIRYCRSIK